jgi:hypothetical protein
VGGQQVIPYAQQLLAQQDACIPGYAVGQVSGAYC